MTLRRSSSDVARLFGLVAAVVALAALYLGQAFLIPLALASLLSLILTPLVRQLQKLRVPRVPAVLFVVFVVMSTAVAVGIVVTNQLLDVAADLPSYRGNIEKKLELVHDGGNAHVVRAVRVLGELGAEVVRTLPGPGRPEFARTGRPPFEAKPKDPLPVRVVTTPVNSLESALAFLAPVGGALVVLVFTIFILLRTDDIRHRFIRLVGQDHINSMTKAMDDASQRIGRYLLLQFAVNLCYGIVIAVGLGLIGLPNALLWGAVAAALRFLPYVGPPAGGLLPILYSLAVFDGWTRSLVIVGSLVALEFVVANLIEPLLYGAKTGISSLAILVAAVFWTLLWGPIGLVLSTPLTVCLVVLGQYVPQLEFLQVMLGHEAEVTPAMHFYQRLIAFDLADARQILEQNLRSASLVELYDSTIVPALVMVQRDRQQNELEDRPAEFIVQNARELVEDLNENYIEPRGTTEQRAIEVPADMAKSLRPVICVPARTSVDETIAIMLAQLLEREGKPALCISADSHAEMIRQMIEENTDVVVVSALQPFGLVSARRLVNQIRTRMPHVTVVIGLWNFTGEIEGLLARFGAEAQMSIATSLAAAVKKVDSLAIERRIEPDSKLVASA